MPGPAGMIRASEGPAGARAVVRAALLAGSMAALVLSSLALPAPVRAQGQLPSLGDGGGLTLGAERRLGERIARELYRDPSYIDDPVLADYIQSLWDPLLAAARQRGDLGAELEERFAWRILLSRDRSVNAFAVPGGWLGLHLGLVAVTQTRDEVASVLAHELSHVTQRHISRMVAQDSRQTPWVVGAMILGAIAASRSPDAANALITGGQALAVQNQLNFSRDMEREADRVGFGVLSQAGFEPLGFVTMFERLQQAARLNDTGAYPYLRTHPLTTERISDMRARVPIGATAAAPADVLHTVMAARARVLSAAGVDTLQALVREADITPADAPLARQAPALYAGTLAAQRLRDRAKAERLLARLAALPKTDPRISRAVRLLAGELALVAGDATRAAAAAGMAPASGPMPRPELLLTAHAALVGGQPAEAASRLQTWVATHPADAAAWQLLAQAQGARGQPLAALRAEAESRVAMLDYPAALDRLRAAQELARRAGADHIEASIVDARARQVDLLVREQAAER